MSDEVTTEMEAEQAPVEEVRETLATDDVAADDEGDETVDAEAQEGEEDAEPSISPELRSNMTRSHRSVISARDRTYAAYKVHYASRVKEINAACERTLSEERQWTANWKKLVNRIAIEPIDE